MVLFKVGLSWDDIEELKRLKAYLDVSGTRLQRFDRDSMATSEEGCGVEEAIAMTTFALVHGGAHGGWCWESVEPELARLGHRSIAPDLPIEDDGADLRDWATTVIEALPADAGDDVIVVGHSLAGLVIPVIAAMRPVRRLVFLGAVVPALGITPKEQQDREGMILVSHVGQPSPREQLPKGGGGMAWADARRYFYHDVDETIARHAWDRLRHQSLRVLTDPFPLASWPEVPMTYIVMSEDCSVDPRWSRRYARDVLGADVIELPGSHSPFYSRPQELAETLAIL